MVNGMNVFGIKYYFLLLIGFQACKPESSLVNYRSAKTSVPCDYSIKFPKELVLISYYTNDEVIDLKVRNEFLDITYTVLVKRTTDNSYFYDYGPYPFSTQHASDSMILNHIKHKFETKSVNEFTRKTSFNTEFLITDILNKNGNRYIQADYIIDSLSVVLEAFHRKSDDAKEPYNEFMDIFYTLDVKCP